MSGVSDGGEVPGTPSIQEPLTDWQLVNALDLPRELRPIQMVIRNYLDRTPDAE